MLMLKEHNGRVCYVNPNHITYISDTDEKKGCTIRLIYGYSVDVANEAKEVAKATHLLLFLETEHVEPFPVK